MKNPVLISTAPFDGYELSDAIEEIAAVGADGIEIAFIEGYTDPFTEEDFTEDYAAEILSHLETHKLPCLSFSAHMDLTKENGVEIFKRRMIFARQLGTKTIITNAAPISRADQFYSNIRELGEFAKSIGINIGLENPGDGNANVIDTAEVAASVIAEINLETVGLNYDFGNLISHRFEHVKPEEDYRFAIPQTNHYHIKDVIRLDKGWGFCPIGEGIIDYGNILPAIASDPRPLPVSLEIPLRITRNADAGPVRSSEAVDIKLIRQTLQKSMNFVRKSLAGSQ